MVDAITGAGLVAVEVAGGITTAMYVGSAFGRREESVRRSVVMIAVLCALTLLGAHWVAHAGAGISVAALSTVAFGAPRKVKGRLVVSVLAIVVFAMLGAGWALYPLAGLGAFAAINLLGRGGPGACGGGSRRGTQRHNESSRPVDLRKEPPATAPKDRATAGLAIYLLDERVPAAARDRIRSISERARAAGVYLDQQGRGSGLDALEVERIRDDYAPGAVRGYLALPPWSAKDTVLADGKTGSQLLIDQLDMLDRRLREIQESVALTGGAELLTHGRFLKDRFPEHGGDDLRI